MVLGAGTAGSSAAKVGAARRAKTALVEADGFAGLCLGAGCIPKKVLVNTVELLWRAQGAWPLGDEPPRSRLGVRHRPEGRDRRPLVQGEAATPRAARDAAC
ncbi:MAG: FAD-dependent oxidoreductase [Candidatus Rokuibacteriota bacterium]